MKHVLLARKAMTRCDSAAVMLEHAEKCAGPLLRQERRAARRHARKYLAKAQGQIVRVLRELEKARGK